MAPRKANVRPVPAGRDRPLGGACDTERAHLDPSTFAGWLWTAGRQRLLPPAANFQTTGCGPSAVTEIDRCCGAREYAAIHLTQL